MNMKLSPALLVIAALLLPPAVGCDSTPPPPVDGDVHDDHSDHDHSGHDHAAEHEGPHGGHVIELGREHAYHAELIEDEQAQTVTVYMLDKDLKELAVDNAPIVMNLTVDGQAQTFELTATNAIDGKSPSFASSGPELFQAIHEHGASGKLRVTIDGTPYSGAVEHHHHDHDGHDH
ncbi:MAG: hypothetical protein KC561_19845 [Myxococcales bacterium]|nr:hypothetical protein [Myxococcales bacterium]